MGGETEKAEAAAPEDAAVVKAVDPPAPEEKADDSKALVVVESRIPSLSKRI